MKEKFIVKGIKKSLFKAYHALKFTGMFLVLALMVQVITAPNLFAQEATKHKLTGKVTAASDNSPIPAASIQVKGSNVGTIANVEGVFSLDVADNDILVVSFIGYKTEEVAVAGKSMLDIKISEDITKLDEVVVIGYGIQKKKLVTGATVQVKGDELAKQNTTSPLQAMQGKTPGVNITSQSGQPGEGQKVVIRGAGTINNSSPLYIVDGVQVGDIKYLNTNDIESIDVLKDAASAAIYGSQGANGVILVTTKQGKAGKSQVTFDAYYGVQNRAKKIGLLDAKQYAMIKNEMYVNSGGDKTTLPFDVNNLPQYTKSGPANTNWLDQMFVQNSPMQNYSLGITGGSENSVYAISLGYTGQVGIVGGKSVSDYERYNARVNTEHKLYNKKLKIGQHLSFSHTMKNGIGVGNIYGNTLRSAFGVSPLMPVYDDAGNYFNTANDTILDINPNSKTYGKQFDNTAANPYASMMINNQNVSYTQNLLADIYSELEIIRNLKLRTTFGIDYSSYDYRSYSPIYELSIYSQNKTSGASQNMSKNMTWNVDNVLTYNLKINNHILDFMVGNSVRKYKGSYINASNTNLAYSDFQHAWLSNATNTNSASSMKINGAPNDDNAMLSYFGRLQYNYKETYMLNLVFRADGSSKFASNHQWGHFPSASAGWVISNESFMAPLASVFNFLKLRGSWGQNGNSNIDAYSYLATIAFTNANYSFGSVEGVNTNGSYPDKLSNENVKWETSEQLNFGFDSRFLNNKLNFEFDWYRKSTKDWLIKAPVLATAGTEAPWINGGDVNNTGVEFNLGYENHFGKLHYNISANGAYNKNNVTNIPTTDEAIRGGSNALYNNSEDFYEAKSGQPMGSFWGYKTNGIFQTAAEVNDYLNTYGKTLQSNPVPGDVRFVDTNNDGVIDTKDKTEIGDPNPDFMYGFSLSLDYKAFDLFIGANGVMGNQLIQSYRNPEKNQNYTTAILDRWTHKGTSNKIPRVTEDNINYAPSDLFVQNGDYLRINNVTLGFDLAKVAKIKNLSQCRFYASVQNLYTFTKYDGMDPEVGYGLDNGPMDRFSSGIDLGFYPRPRTVLFGISVKF